MKGCVALLLAFASLPATARASTAEIVTVSSCTVDKLCFKYGGGVDVPVVTYTGAPGEANRVTLLRPAGRVVIHDDQATITAKAPCEATGEHEASCPPGGGSGIGGLIATLGDRDDALRVQESLGTSTLLTGGDGADTISGGLDPDAIDGGAGSDRLDGGAGIDRVLYTGHATGVTLDLAAGRGGGPGEVDALAGFEQVFGSRFEDTLIGSARDDVLSGDDGNDTLRGGGGADMLGGERGSDRLSGGDGRDQLSGDDSPGPYGNDRLSGGAGNDELSDTGGTNVLDGGPGDDELQGGKGADRLLGGAGRDVLSSRTGNPPDRISGGSGNDVVQARNRRRDRVSCGPGRDRVYADRGDRLSRCERRLLRAPPSGG